jgi:hypothetical protein
MFAFIKKLKILPKNNKTKGGTMPQTLKRMAYLIISSHCFPLLLLSSKRKRVPGILYDTKVLFKLKIKNYCENKIRVAEMRILC